jgi:hypothetical protein
LGEAESVPRCRWIARNQLSGRAAGEQHPEKCLEEAAARRQHDGHRLSRPVPARVQAGRDPATSVVERAVGDRLLGLCAGTQDQVSAVGVSVHVPRERFQKGGDALGNRLGDTERRVPDARRFGRGCGSSARQEAREQIAWCTGRAQQ